MNNHAANPRAEAEIRRKGEVARVEKSFSIYDKISQNFMPEIFLTLYRQRISFSAT
jgi:hypothetical protein